MSEMSRREFLKTTITGVLGYMMAKSLNCKIKEGYGEYVPQEEIARRLLQNDKTFSLDAHIHPEDAYDYIENAANIADYLRVMKEKDLEAIGVAGYMEKEVWPSFLLKAIEYRRDKKRLFEPEIQDVLIQFNSKENGKKFNILKAQELRSNQNLDIYALGYNGHIKKADFPDMIQEIHEKGGIAIGHTLYVDNDNELTGSISKGLEEKLIGYCTGEPEGRRVDAFDFSAAFRPDVRYLLKKKIKGIWKLLNEGTEVTGPVDVNGMVKELAKKLGFSVVPYTDLHVRNSGHLDYLATSFAAFIYDSLDFSNDRTLIASLRKHIKENNFIGFYREISLLCLYRTIVWPRINKISVD